MGFLIKLNENNYVSGGASFYAGIRAASEFFWDIRFPYFLF